MTSTHHLQLGRRGAVLFLVMALLFAALGPARTAAAAGPIVVNTTNGTANDNSDSTCTLLEAIQAANTGTNPYRGCKNATSGPDLINFDVSGPIVLQQDTINIISNISIVGLPTPAIISGNEQRRIFRVVGSNATFNLGPAITLQDGAVDGSGAAILIESNATVNIAGVSFINNVASGGNGGAISNQGSTLKIAGGNFLNNRSTATAAGNGGAIDSSGSAILEIAGSNFDGNSAVNSGGAIHNLSQNAIVSDSVFAGNTALVSSAPSGDPLKGGGAIANFQNASLRVVRTSFAGNSTPLGYGGALYNTIQATTVISTSSFYTNAAGSLDSFDARGGAIYTMGNLTADKVAFLLNATLGHGGAIANDRTAVVNLHNSAFYKNAATKTGGAIINQNTQQGGNAPTINAINTTFDNNNADAAAPSGGAIFNTHGVGAVTLKNSIVANSKGGNCNAPATSLGHNLDSSPAGSASACVSAGGTNIRGLDPKLDAPGLNGGPTFIGPIASLLTQKLLAGSPAIDAGDPAACAAAPIRNEDQRGEPRPKDGDGNGTATCDIGAFESDKLEARFSSTPAAPGPLTFGNVLFNTSAETTLSIAETGNTDLTVNTAQFGGANAVDFKLAAGQTMPLTIADGAAAASLKIVCTPPTATQRTATLSLSTNDPTRPTVSYNLICDGVQGPTPGFGSTPAAPGPVNWGEVTINTAKPFTIKILETGTDTLTIEAAALSGDNAADFSISTAMPLNIANTEAGNSANLVVTCKPTALGIRVATLTLVTNDDDRPSVAFTLTCYGAPVPSPLLSLGGSAPLTSPLLDGPYDVAISPDGKSVYMTGYNNDSIATFSRNPATGGLTVLDTKVDATNLNGAKNIAISPDGKNVYVAASLANRLVTYKRDTATGKLTFNDAVFEGASYDCPGGTCTLDGISGISAVSVSPDGKFVYATGSLDNAVVVLKRSQTTGGLSFFGIALVAQVVKAADVNADPTLKGVNGLAISPDGATVYTAAETSDTLAAYTRDATTGKLTFAQKLVQGQSSGGKTVDGLDVVKDVAVSPAGDHVYAVATSNAVASFERDATTGALTWLAALKSSNNIPAMVVPAAIAVSPDGANVYVSSFGTLSAGNAVIAFDRSSGSGLLTHRQSVQRSPVSGPDGQPPLGGARGIAVSPDSNTVFTAAFYDNRLVLLNRANPVPSIESISPASVKAGSAGFTLDLYGRGFMADGKSTVKIGAASYAPTYLNSTHLRIAVPAAEVQAAGSKSITVVNAGPGGGVSNAVTLLVTANNDNPLPSVSAISPDSTTVGGPAFTLEVYGASFVSGATVRWNGSDRPTTFVSATHLRAAIAADDIKLPGPASVSVRNPEPGGGLSNAKTFMVLYANQYATPAILSLEPKSITTFLTNGIPAERTLTINGNNFIPESVAYWNGQPRATEFVSNTQLRIKVSASEQVTAADNTITVRNVEEDKTSNEETFSVTVVAVSSRTYVPLVRK